MGKTKVLIIDDSALVRAVLTAILSSDAELEVVGAANDPYAGWERIKTLKPDVVTLDVEMPRMDGLTFLEKLMRAHPMPVVMVSSLTERGCETTLRALELGAVDFVSKPKLDVERATHEMGEEIIGKVKAAASARVSRNRAGAEVRGVEAAAAAPLMKATHRVIAVGASTGGTEALKEVLTALPADAPGMVIVQHMPAGYTEAFARRLDGLSRVEVREARDGDRVLAGHALLAPGGMQMEVVRSGAMVSVRVHGGERVNRHRPSVDVLFQSCARELGSNAIGLIMTGMGADGAQGLLAMRRAGARTLAQDEASSVVFGMPREAIQAGAAEQVVSLAAAAATLLKLASA